MFAILRSLYWKFFSPEVLFTDSIGHNWDNNLFQYGLIFTRGPELVFAPAVTHAVLRVLGPLSWFRQTDRADVILQLEGRAHEQQGEVVVVVTGVQVRVFLVKTKSEMLFKYPSLTMILLTLRSW